MSNPMESSPVGDEMLEAVSESMAALHDHYFGRRPTTVHAQLMADDVLACVLGDMYTDVEKTLIEIERQAVGHEHRSAFHHAMEHRFINEVDRITGRRVQRFITTHHIGPDVEVELFLWNRRTRYSDLLKGERWGSEQRVWATPADFRIARFPATGRTSIERPLHFSSSRIKVLRRPAGRCDGRAGRHATEAVVRWVCAALTAGSRVLP